VLAAGQSIGNYRILNKIGTGGMGAVYLAEHPLIGKRVALKVIHRELAGNRDVVSRFFQEARAVNKIGNEHIVEIHDFGVSPEGDHFYIMEYLEGLTLASVLSREKVIDVMRALYIAAQIANALAAAHAAGIIHRDLKPDNIMLMTRLGDRDFVKVLDFGLAKVFSAGTAVKTAAGVLLGTPQYMSPEACEGRGEIDHRTDVYALGVLLFQMMTGVLPFDGDTMGDVLVKQVTTLPPAPRAMNPAIPPSVEQILLRCLAKPVDARFATMAQLREALLDPESYLRSAPPIAPARSVSSAFALGEASTVAMQAVTDAAPIPASLQKTRVATGALPLPAPMLSIAAPMAAPNAAHAVPPLAPVTSPTAAPAATTLIAAPPIAVPVQRLTAGMPAAQPLPQEPAMNTMRIATPVGYTSRPPRKVWPTVLGMAVVLGVTGGIVSVTCFGHDAARPGSDDLRAGAGSADDGSAAAGRTAPASPPGPQTRAAGSAASASPAPATATATASPASPASAPAAPPGAGAATGSPSPAPSGTTAGSSTSADAPARPSGVRTAHLTIESVPLGATVKGPDGTALGKTPLAVEWPTATTAVRFELRLAGYKPKHKQTVIAGNTRLVIELERERDRDRDRAPPRRNGPKASGTGNGLMRPDD
jgi:tRNA A-37 threonylcarbamoyl transferase component Bud32